MANPLGVWETATGAIIGLATGEALSEAVQPVFEVLKQTAWRNKPTRVLDAQTAALVDAQQIPTKVDTADDARRGGVGPARYSALQQLALAAPGTAELLALWRRDEIGKPDFLHGLAKASLEPEWFAGLAGLFYDRLDIATIANGVQQGFLPNPGVLPAQVDTEPGKIKSQPAQNIDVIAEAKSQGYDLPRLKVFAGLAGLPPGPMEMLFMLRRGLIDVSDFNRGVAQGHTKTEWTPAYLGLVDNIISASEAATLRLKGWISAEDSYALGALNGYDQAAMDHLYLAGGRPPAPGQMATAVARGFADKADFDKAIVESDIRPEWADLLYDIRHNYPSLFFTKGAVASGSVGDDVATQWLINEKFTPDDAALLVKSFHVDKVAKVKQITEADILAFYEVQYIGPDDATADLKKLGYTDAEAALLLEHASAQRVLKFMNAALERIHAGYVSYKLTSQQAIDEIGALGIPGSSRDNYLGLWDTERQANAPQATSAGIIALGKAGVISPDAAYQSLINRGWLDLAARAEVAQWAGFNVPGSLPSILTTPI